MRSKRIKITIMKNEMYNHNSGIAKPNEKSKVRLIGFIILYLLIAIGFVAIGPRVFSSTWVSSSDFHSCIEISSSFIAIIAAVSCLMYYFGFKSRYYLLCGLGFFICGSEDFIHGLLSFARLFSGIEADLSKFVPGTYVAGRSSFAIFIILAVVLGERTRPSKSVRKETIFFSLIALIVGAGMTALAIMVPLPKLIYPEQLISRPVDFVSAVLFAIAFVVVLKRYLAERSIFSGFLLACVLLNIGGQIYMSFSKQLFDIFFDVAHWANILSYCMPVLGIAVQALKEIKKSKGELAARKQAEKELKEHRDHLEELVEKRTTELESANSGLRHEIAERKQAEADRERLLHDMGERMKEQRCMYGVADSIQKRETLEEVFQDVVMLIPPGWHYPEITCSRVIVEGAEFKTNNFKETQWKQSADINIFGIKAGTIEVYYLKECPESDEGPFLKEERTLINAVAERVGRIIERKRTEEDLKAAHKELETANHGLKEVQSQMVQSEKLASIGQLAAGVAHEMNTPVGFVASNFQTLESYVEKVKKLLGMYGELATNIKTSGKAELLDKAGVIEQSRGDMKIDFVLEDIQGLFDDSKEGLKSVTDIIQNLRDFSRIDQLGSLDEYNLNKGIKATLMVAQNEIKYDADVVTEFSELPNVLCHSDQINQVLLNILINAAQAIQSQEKEGKGAIIIKTYATDSDVVCEISDNGPGIDPDTQSKIFDPFFTTRPAGSGTGLGLAISYDIIAHKHDGKLLVDSTVGKGTKFTIELPIKKENQNNKKEIKNNGKQNSIIC